MYTQDLFGGERTIHVGLDIGGPAQTPIFAFEDGRIHSLQTTMRMDLRSDHHHRTLDEIDGNSKASGFFTVTCHVNR